MGFMSIASKFRRRSGSSPTPPTNILPFFGAGPVVTQAQKTSAFILSLPSRGPTPDRLNPGFTLSSANNNTTMYYAYPVSYGQATFTDVQANFQGGWDGAHGNFGNTLGPIIVKVNIGGFLIDFYLYQTDYPNLGTVLWSAT